MKWLMILAPFLVGLIAAIAAVVSIGLMLPTAHRGSRAAHLHRPPEEVWAVLTDFASHPTWRTGLREVKPLPDRNGHPVWQETDAHGEAIPMEIEILEPPRRIVSRIADPNLPFGGTWTYELSPTDSGCTLRITEDGEVYNPVFRYVSKIMGHTATMETFLRSLGRKFGEDVTPEP